MGISSSWTPELNLTSSQEVAKQKAMATLLSLNERATLKAALDTAGIPSSPPAQFWSINRPAVMFWREYVNAGGLELDPTLWHIEAGAEVCIADAVADALIKGQDSARAAANFLYTSGKAADIMLEDIDHLIDEYTSFGDHIDSLFRDWINLAFVSVQDTIWQVG